MLLPTIAIAVLMSPLAGTPQSNKEALDFWVGNWVVTEQNEKVGDDVVEKLVKGNGVVERWTDVAGGEGMSLFYFMPAKNQWKQVWVTPAGAYKEKYSEDYPNGIRFAGTVFLPNGKTYRDRTTLTRMEGGRVHQVIEAFKDKKWQVAFDAIYTRVPEHGGK